MSGDGQSDNRWNVFVGASVATLLSCSGWLVLEVIGLKLTVARNEERIQRLVDNVDAIVEELVLPAIRRAESERTD